jgi:hypothetical protein
MTRTWVPRWGSHIAWRPSWILEKKTSSMKMQLKHDRKKDFDISLYCFPPSWISWISVSWDSYQWHKQLFSAFNKLI